MYAANHRPPDKEVGENVNHRRGLPCLWVGRLRRTTMPVLLKMICGFNATPVETPPRFFVHINKLIVKFIRKCTGPRRATIILKKKNKGGGDKSF